MDNVDAYLFVVHPFRHEVLFANRQIRSIRPECVPGSVCYRSFFRFDKPCVDCAILKGRDCLIEKDGQQIYLQLRHKKIRWLNDEMVYLVSGTDITERMLHARKLEHMAYHDSLLDIPNRQAALRNLQHCCARASVVPSSCSTSAISSCSTKPSATPRATCCSRT